MKSLWWEPLILVLVVIIAIYLFFTYYSTSVLHNAALILASIGILFWTLGKMNLGDSWGFIFTKPQAKKLVTTGVYSKIRHPLYYGVLLFIFGMALLLQHIVMWFFAIIVLISIIIRIPSEEKYLAKRFGNAWKRYKEKTWF